MESFFVHRSLAQSDCFRITSLGTLVEDGSSKTFPEFHNPDRWDELFLNVKHLRLYFFTERFIATADEVAAIRRRVMTFPSIWHAPIFFASISFHRRDCEDVAILYFTGQARHGREIPRSREIDSLYSDDTRILAQVLADVIQFIDMFDLVYGTRSIGRVQERNSVSPSQVGL